MPHNSRNAELRQDGAGGFGFFTQRELPAHALVCSVPVSRLICFSTQRDEGSPMFKLAYYLLEHGQNSVYVSSLPWYTCQRSFASLSRIADAIAARDDESFDISVQQLDCALYLVQSRVHLVKGRGMCLVPLCDMFNRATDNTSNNVECSNTRDDHHFSCWTTTDVPVNSALLVHYRDASGNIVQDGKQWGI